MTARERERETNRTSFLVQKKEMQCLGVGQRFIRIFIDFT